MSNDKEQPGLDDREDEPAIWPNTSSGTDDILKQLSRNQFVEGIRALETKQTSILEGASLTNNQ